MRNTVSSKTKTFRRPLGDNKPVKRAGSGAHNILKRQLFAVGCRSAKPNQYDAFVTSRQMPFSTAVAACDLRSDESSSARGKNATSAAHARCVAQTVCAGTAANGAKCHVTRETNAVDASGP